MKPFLLLCAICCIIAADGIAQDTKPDKPTYKTAIGLRFSPFGLSVKSNLAFRKRSFELVGYFKDGFTATGLYYWNFTLNHPGNVKLYAGASSQVGFRNERAGGGAVLGLGGVVGADYKFLHLPINLSLDWQPSFQFGNTNEFKGWGGLAARFTF